MGRSSKENTEQSGFGLKKLIAKITRRKPKDKAALRDVLPEQTSPDSSPRETPRTRGRTPKERGHKKGKGHDKLKRAIADDRRENVPVENTDPAPGPAMLPTARPAMLQTSPVQKPVTGPPQRPVTSSSGVIRATRSAENIHKSCYTEGLLSHGNLHRTPDHGSDNFVDRLKNVSRSSRRRSYSSVPSVVIPDRIQPLSTPAPQPGREFSSRPGPGRNPRPQEQRRPPTSGYRTSVEGSQNSPDVGAKPDLKERRRLRQKYHADRAKRQDMPVYIAPPRKREGSPTSSTCSQPSDVLQSRPDLVRPKHAPCSHTYNRSPEETTTHLEAPYSPGLQHGLYQFEHVDSVSVEGFSPTSTLERHCKHNAKGRISEVLQTDPSTPLHPVIHYHLTIQNCDGINVLLSSPDGTAFHPKTLVSSESGLLKRMSWVQGDERYVTDEHGQSMSDVQHSNRGITSPITSPPPVNHSFNLDSAQWGSTGARSEPVDAWYPGEHAFGTSQPTNSHLPQNNVHFNQFENHESKQTSELNSNNSACHPDYVNRPAEVCSNKHKIDNCKTHRDSTTVVGQSPGSQCLKHISQSNKNSLSSQEIRKPQETKSRPIAQVRPFRPEITPERPGIVTRLAPAFHHGPQMNNTSVDTDSFPNQSLSTTLIYRAGAVPATSMSSLTTEGLLEADAHGGLSDSEDDLDTTLEDVNSSDSDTNSVVEVTVGPETSVRNRQTRPHTRDFRQSQRSESADRSRTRDLSAGLQSRDYGETPFRRHQSVRERGRVREDAHLDRLKVIKRELVRVPGVLIVQITERRLVVYLSRDRPNVEGVVRFMRANGVRRGEYDCQVVPWRPNP